jgi:hypothetical protein
MMHIDSITTIRGWLPETGLLIISGPQMSGKTTVAQAIRENWPAVRLTDGADAERIARPPTLSPSLRHFLFEGPMAVYLKEVRTRPDGLHIFVVTERKFQLGMYPVMRLPQMLLNNATAAIRVQAESPQFDPPFRRGSGAKGGTIRLEWLKNRHEPLPPDVMASADALRKEG